MIRSATTDDAPSIATIYNHYIEHSWVTFEELTLSDEVMALRMEAILKRFPWLVWEERDRVLGYAYASEWNSRPSYRYSAEATVYLDHRATGRGIGTGLYRELIARLDAAGFHRVIGGVALPNPASVALHRKLGFRQAARFTEVGRKFDHWHDVDYWELSLGDGPTR